MLLAPQTIKLRGLGYNFPDRVLEYIEKEINEKHNPS